jgi:ribosomal protein S27AE
MAQHSLTWEPGGYGRGLLLEDGSVHTWQTGDGGNGKTHEQARRHLGSPPVASYFWLGKDGKLDFGEAWTPDLDPEPHHVQAIMAADPRTSWSPPENYTHNWTFSKAQPLCWQCGLPTMFIHQQLVCPHCGYTEPGIIQT